MEHESFFFAEAEYYKTAHKLKNNVNQITSPDEQIESFV